jgi:hypothetical protein
MDDISTEAATLPHQGVDRCDLLAAYDGTDRPCDGSACVYWRVLGHVGVEKPEECGCAVRYFDLLAEEQPRISAWLVSVKARFEEAGVMPASGVPVGGLLPAAAADEACRTAE